jgi:hypothetical protein
VVRAVPLVAVWSRQLLGAIPDWLRLGMRVRDNLAEAGVYQPSFVDAAKSYASILCPESWSDNTLLMVEPACTLSRVALIRGQYSIRSGLACRPSARRRGPFNRHCFVHR